MEKELEQLESLADVKEVIVIDNGSESIKIGYSGEDQPRIELEAVGGTYTIKDDVDNIQNKKQQYLFGNNLKQALVEQKYQIDLCSLVERSKVSNFEFMGYFWEYVIEQLLQFNEITACNLLIVDNAYNSKEYKQEFSRVLFEQVKVQSLLFMNSATASLLSSGQTTGLVVESGHGSSTVTPIFEGFPILYAQKKSLLAGSDVTSCLREELLTLPSWDPERIANSKQQLNEIIKNIKEKLCHCSLDYQYDLSYGEELDIEQKSFELPDGTILEINKTVKYKPAEIMFKPELVNSDQNSLTYMMQDCLDRCDSQLVTELLKSVMICGGNSHLHNFPERIKFELSENITRDYDINEINYNVESQRKYNSWVGASMVGSLSTFQQLAIMKNEYEESLDSKSSIIQKRTF